LSKIPSPCIDVCKFKRKGHCIGCSMTKKQKAAFKKLDKKKDKLAFFQALLDQQTELGGYAHWMRTFEHRCRKKGHTSPLAKLPK